MMRVGDAVWYERWNGGKSTLTEATIESIGRRWVTVSYSGWMCVRFDKNTLYVDGYGNGRIWLTLQDYNDFVELKKLWQLLKRHFDRHASTTGAKLEDLRKVVEILGCGGGE